MKNLSIWQLAGYTFAVLFGTLFHFLFEWTELIAVAPFCAVNESTWEHMKILFFPMLLFAIVQSRFFGYEKNGFWWIKLIGVAIGVSLIPIQFYTYNGAFGKPPDWLNILFFFTAAGIAYLIEGILFLKDFHLPFQWIAILLLSLIGGLFVLFTFLTPALPLFQDPITRLYGIITRKTP